MLKRLYGQRKQQLKRSHMLPRNICSQLLSAIGFVILSQVHVILDATFLDELVSHCSVNEHRRECHSTGGRKNFVKRASQTDWIYSSTSLQISCCNICRVNKTFIEGVLCSVWFCTFVEINGFSKLDEGI